jgi:RimJ/RimL family protein N-acetyltransferase
VSELKKVILRKRKLRTIMHTLPQESYPNVLPLLAGIPDHLAPLALLAGRASGTVFVDDLANPQAALLRAAHRYYLVGRADLNDFNQRLAQYFNERVVSNLLPGWGFPLYYAEDGWVEAVGQVILPELTLYQPDRQYYSLDLDTAQDATAAELPGGFQLRAVDQALLEQANIANMDDLLEEMQSERVSVEEFLANSFGMVLVGDGLVISWCLSEYNLGDNCEVGIATTEGYRQRGFAALTGEAFLRQARSQGIRRVGWHCWARNTPSSAAARRLGFELVKTSPTLYLEKKAA